LIGERLQDPGADTAASKGRQDARLRECTTG
jgi:hypothetical protein